MRSIGLLVVSLICRAAAGDEVTAVSAGDRHTCALLQSGQVMCWGSSPRLHKPTRMPERIDGISDAIAISAGDGHTCALGKAGDVRCWGWNNFGQLGDGKTRDLAQPVAAGGVASVAAVFAGHRTTCTLGKNGGVRCFGEGEHGEPNALYTPAALTSHAVAALSAPNAQLTVALLKDLKLDKGENGDSPLLAWGNDLDRGHLPSPRRIDGITMASALGGRRCALLRSGEVACWGYRHSGQRGDGRVDEDLSPRAELFAASRVQGLRDAVALADGGLFSCAVRRSGQVACWGSNREGQLGSGTRTLTPVAQPVAVAGLDGVVALSAGGQHACALRRGGTVYCWGDNLAGQLGDGTIAARAHPVAVLGLPGSPVVTTDPRREGETAQHAYRLVLDALRAPPERQLLQFVSECAANETCQQVCRDALTHLPDRARVVAGVRTCLPALSERAAPQLSTTERRDLAAAVQQLPATLGIAP